MCLQLLRVSRSKQAVVFHILSLSVVGTDAAPGFRAEAEEGGEGGEG